MNDAHTLSHALHGCQHDMKDIHACVLCNRTLARDRQHVDTCGEVCFKQLLRMQQGRSS